MTPAVEDENPYPSEEYGGAVAESVPRGDVGIAPYAYWVDAVEGIGAMAGASPRPTMWQAPSAWYKFDHFCTGELCLPVVRTAYRAISSIFNGIDLNCRTLNRCRIILAPCVMRCVLEVQTGSTVPAQANTVFHAVGYGGAAAESVPRGDEGIAPYTMLALP